LTITHLPTGAITEQFRHNSANIQATPLFKWDLQTKVPHCSGTEHHIARELFISKLARPRSDQTFPHLVRYGASDPLNSTRSHLARRNQTHNLGVRSVPPPWLPGQILCTRTEDRSDLAHLFGRRPGSPPPRPGEILLNIYSGNIPRSIFISNPDSLSEKDKFIHTSSGKTWHEI